MKSYTKITGSTVTELFENTISRFNKIENYYSDVEKVVVRYQQEGVDAVYMLEPSPIGLILNPIDKRFADYQVSSIEEALSVLKKEYGDSLPDIAFCGGTRGLTQFLITLECKSYSLETILEGIHGDDAIMTIFKCAKALGLEMNLKAGSIDGSIEAYGQLNHKLRVDGEGMYTMDIASTIREQKEVNISLSK